MSFEEISHTNSDDAADNFLTRQFERQNGKDFLNERQQELTLRKSPNPHISWGVSAAPAEAELTVPSTNEVINDAGDIAVSNPSLPRMTSLTGLIAETSSQRSCARNTSTNTKVGKTTRRG